MIYSGRNHYVSNITSHRIYFVAKSTGVKPENIEIRINLTKVTGAQNPLEIFYFDKENNKFLAMDWKEYTSLDRGVNLHQAQNYIGQLLQRRNQEVLNLENQIDFCKHKNDKQ